MSSVSYFFNRSKLNKIVSRDLIDNSDTYEYNIHNQQVVQPLNDHETISEQLHNVMPSVPKEHKEAYFLYFIAIAGIILNCLVVLAIFVRKPLRKMTSGFLIHACFLDFLKSAYCIPIGTNLLSQSKPADCNFFGATYVILITISVFNMVAMVCTEAYTFGEKNVGGNSKGTVICITFGIVLVYIGSVILHLGPTLIGGHFEFQSEIGSCSFVLGKQTGYVPHAMWVLITTIAILAVFHFIHNFYKEIQINRPNRVSFLVRSSITVLDSGINSTCKLREIIQDAMHRAKMFILNTVVFIACWYPLFLLILIDKYFQAPVQIYQAFAFIAWSHGAIQPLLYICFDQNIDILARKIYSNRYKYDLDTILKLMKNQRSTNDHQEQQSNMAEGEISYEPQARVEPSTLIIHEHQRMCVVQNSSNQNADNNTENLDLTNQLSPCLNIPIGHSEMINLGENAHVLLPGYSRRLHNYHNIIMDEDLNEVQF